ncbi:Amino-acid permease inda1 [Rhodotorula toruloides]
MDSHKTRVVSVHPSLSPSLAASNAPRPAPSSPASPADKAEGEQTAEAGQDGLEAVGGHVDPLKPVVTPMLQQKMKPPSAPRGSIGTGLFIASGQRKSPNLVGSFSSTTALNQAGPLEQAHLVLIVLCLAFANITQALGELAIVFPVSGGWGNLAIRFVDRSFGAAVTYNYAALWCVVLPLELTAAAIAVQYWEAAAREPVTVWITWASLLKLGVVVVFIVIGIVLNCGGGKNEYSTYVGGRYWRDPGPLADGFHGVAAVFVTAAFSFGEFSRFSLASMSV